MNELIKLCVIIIFIFLLTGCNNTQTTNATIDYKKAQEYITTSEKQWAESVVTGDTIVIKKIIADDFIGIEPEGNQYTKQQMLDFARNAPKDFKSNVLNNVNIRFYGNTAVVQGDETWVRYSGQQLTGRFVWTDIWVLQNDKWQIVASEDLIPPVK